MTTCIRKSLWAAAVAASWFAVVGIARTEDTPEVPPSETATVDELLKAPTTEGTPSATSESAQSTTEATKQPATIKFDGRGRQASQKFTLEPGLAIFRTTHKGKSNYTVYLTNDQGEGVNTLFNTIGKYDGAQGFEIRKGGQYLLDVHADGPWSFQIDQPRPTTGKPSPQTITGTKPDVSPSLLLKKGLSVFKFTYKGERGLSVSLLDANGRRVEHMVNVLGAFDGSTPVKVPEDGVYFINVSAEGEWQVDVQ